MRVVDVLARHKHRGAMVTPFASRIASTPVNDVAPAAPIEDTPESTAADPTGGELIELPWYYSWWRVAAVAVAATLFGVGAVLIATDDQPGADSVDVGFLQDMRSHHDQAVLMSLTLLQTDDIDPLLRTIAAEILLSQQLETGVMVEILGSFGAAEENSSEIAMDWMGQPVPLDRMPGMASEAELDRLEAASGPEAETLFAELMIAHHEGGIVMAEHAADHATTGRVRDAARAMALVQTEEAAELRSIVARLGSPG